MRRARASHLRGDLQHSPGCSRHRLGGHGTAGVIRHRLGLSQAMLAGQAGKPVRSILQQLYDISVASPSVVGVVDADQKLAPLLRIDETIRPV